MTQEDKQLLLKDLCPRIPNGVKVELHSEVCTCLGYFDDFVMLTSNTPMGQQTNIANIKPYLRPMSSMTDKERKDWYSYSRAQYDCEFHPDPTLSLFESHLSVDWLVAHHFDYRGLIPRGLALKAPDDMYK